MASQSTRPASRGSFELHVESVRTTRGLPHLVQPTIVVPPPSYTLPTLASPEYQSRSDNEKAVFDDASSVTITVGDEKSPGQSHRHTTDDGPEPKTLAKYLFMYGFAFPLFWVIGTSILFLDLAYHQTPAELAEDPRTADERKDDLRVLRAAEVRWAWRSLYALISLLLVVAIVLLIWAGATGRFNGLN